jgi:hypothetical protein
VFGSAEGIVGGTVVVAVEIGFVEVVEDETWA